MRIGELARTVGCEPHTIRFYEKKGLLPEAARGENNYRSYGKGHLDRLRFILRCRALDMAHDEIRVLLDGLDHPEESCAPVNGLIDDHLRHVSERIRELQALEAELRDLHRRCQSARPGQDCGILQSLEEGAGNGFEPNRHNHVPTTHGQG